MRVIDVKVYSVNPSLVQEKKKEKKNNKKLQETENLMNGPSRKQINRIIRRELSANFRKTCLCM